MANKVYGFLEVSGLADIFPVNPVNFKQLCIQETSTIPSVKPDIEQIVCFTADVAIKGTRVIDTPVGTSVEGQILTGKKLVVDGLILQKVEYISEEPAQSVHAAHFNIPFSTFIVLPAQYSVTPAKVTGYIEDIFVQSLDKRNILINVTILLDARF